MLGSKLKERFPWDKLAHYVGGGLIYFAIEPFNIHTAVVVAILAGIGKELFDKHIRGVKPDWKDAIATGLGGALPYLSVMI